MSWSNGYIGLPWADLGRDRSGCDCWGLACLIYRDQLGIELPGYVGNYASAGEQTEIAALVDGEFASASWRRVDLPADFDIAVFRAGRWQSHIGVVVRPGIMIHMAVEDRARLERIDTGTWQRRLTGLYRHVKTPVEGGVK